MKVLAAVFLLISLTLMSAEDPAQKLLTKTTKKAVVEKFLTSGHSDRNVRHNWLTVRQWALFINKFLPIQGHVVQTDDVHESIRRDPRLRDLVPAHVDFYGIEDFSLPSCRIVFSPHTPYHHATAPPLGILNALVNFSKFVGEICWLRRNVLIPT